MSGTARSYVRGMCSAMVLHKPSDTGMVLLVNSEVRGLNELVLDFAELYNHYYPAETLRVVARHSLIGCFHTASYKNSLD